MAKTKGKAAARSTSHRPHVEIERPLPYYSRVAELPRPARFLTVVFTSLFLSSSLLTVSSAQTAGRLAGVSRHLEEWWEIGGLILWRTTELGLAWILGFDGWDVTELTLLTHTPIYFLLLNFYEVQPSAVLITLSIEIVSKSLPFALFRGSNSVHALSSPRGGEVANRGILQDWLTALYTSVAAASIYTVFLYLSFSTWLPVHFVLHFGELSDIRLLHYGPKGLPYVFSSLLLGGYAVYDFLFVSSAGWSAKRSRAARSTAEGEYLITSLYNRTWAKLSAKGKILASRTLVLAAVTLLNTIIAGWGSIKGVDLIGSVGWGSLWAAATLTVGAMFAWIEAVPGV